MNHSGSGKRQAKVLEENYWDCSVCTYRNTAEAFKCLMCDVRKGTSTRKPRINPQLVAQQVSLSVMLIHCNFIIRVFYLNVTICFNIFTLISKSLKFNILSISYSPFRLRSNNMCHCWNQARRKEAVAAQLAASRRRIANWTNQGVGTGIRLVWKTSIAAPRKQTRWQLIMLPLLLRNTSPRWRRARTSRAMLAPREAASMIPVKIQEASM